MDAANVIALVTGLIGALLGLLGWLKAREANKIAETANTIARDSKAVAEDANRIAIDANSYAAKANELATEANTITRESFRLEQAAVWEAKVANLVVRKGNTPVIGIPTTKGPGSGFIGINLVNEGPAAAREVQLSATFPDGKVRTSDVRHNIDVGENAELHLPFLPTDFGNDGVVVVEYLITYRDGNDRHARWWSVRVQGPWESQWQTSIEPMYAHG